MTITIKTLITTKTITMRNVFFSHKNEQYQNNLIKFMQNKSPSKYRERNSNIFAATKNINQLSYDIIFYKHQN